MLRQALLVTQNDLVKCQTEANSLRLLIDDTAKLHFNIRKKEDYIQYQTKLTSNLSNQRDSLRESLFTLRSAISDQKDVIADKDRTIRQYGKPKHWGLGIGAGYGFAGQTFGTFFGPVLTYSIIRF